MFMESQLEYVMREVWISGGATDRHARKEGRSVYQREHSSLNFVVTFDNCVLRFCYVEILLKFELCHEVLLEDPEPNCWTMGQLLSQLKS